MALRKVLPFVLTSLAMTGSSSAQEARFERIPAEVSIFLQSLFDLVPAPYISDRIPTTMCRKDKTEPMRGPGGKDIVGAYYCIIDYGCGSQQGTPVWFDTEGEFSFFPDSSGRLTATFCAESISDPGRREYFSSQVQQGG